MRSAVLPRKWTVADSIETFNVRSWAGPYFSVNAAGHCVTHPTGAEGPQIDLKELVDEVRKRGIAPPLLVRFPEILRAASSS